MTVPPIRFCFGVHLHQPIGNFDYVFADHVRDVYLPFLERAVAADFLPVSLHISGPLIEWMERHDRRYLDLIGRLAADGKLELLLAGFYEPVLAALPREDRLEQIGWMQESLHRLFGVRAAGLWLTERVWEPDLAANLCDANVRFALVDDRHFLVTGFRREQLHAPFTTESGGKRVSLFPIDEHLRYLIPFQPPADTAEYLRTLRANGHRLAVIADDGEKFGGWPGTKEWVFDRGWLANFFTTIHRLVDGGEVQLSTFEAALDDVPSSGLAYLGTSSYREMEGWSLPAEQAVRLAAIEEDMGKERIAGPDGALLRGSHWRNFLVKYSESNRMHKKMLALSALTRRRGDPVGPRRAVGRAQCNDAYWHGVFGGLYLPHLREGIWRQLATAEGELRAGEALAHEMLDIDYDGRDEIWVHSSRFSAIVVPHRGGAIEEYTIFGTGRNYADSLTRRREAYHQLGVESEPEHRDATTADDAAPSIHDLEHGLRVDELPPVDLDDRAMFVDRMLPPRLGADEYARADYQPVASWARASLSATVSVDGEAIEIVMTGRFGFEKRIRFDADGSLSVSWAWDSADFPADALFAPEISLARPLVIRAEPDVLALWRYPIETVAKSERGLDRTVQGESMTPIWRARLGAARIDLEAPGEDASPE